MKRYLYILLVALFAASCTSPNEISGEGYHYDAQRAMIIFDEPQPAADQATMLGFAAEHIEVVRVGFVGLGMRGADAVSRFTHIEGVDIRALCDIEATNIARCQQTLANASLPAAAEYVGAEGYKALCERDDIDLVYICTDWLSHTPIAVYAMEQGKHTAIEVPAATSVAECWQLVDTSERTRRHCMMLENCVYDFFELTCLNMAQQGLFGEILHAEGDRKSVV